MYMWTKLNHDLIKRRMFMDIEFKSIEELYNRLLPALRTKKSEMHRCGYTYIREEDIWNYLKEIKWKSSIDLSLYEMVSDVLNVDDTTIDNYLKQKLNMKERQTYFGIEGD